jgi:FGGY-family pentulose kinase
MFKDPTVIGVDIGTESLRTVFFNLHGHVLASASYPIGTTSPIPGQFEQDPTDWWIGLKQTISQCLKQDQIYPESVIGMGFTGTSCTVLPVDIQGQPLRPAIMWMDTRAHVEAEEITQLHHPAIMEASGFISPEWMLPKSLWLKRHEPEIWQKTHKLVEGPDYLVWKLCGNWTASTSSAVGKRNWVWSMGGWPIDLFNKTGIPEFVERNADQVLFPYESAGKLTNSGAQELGLQKGITLVNCGPDAYTATLGSNSFSAGNFSLTTGSSNVHIAPLKTRVRLPGMWGPWCGLLQPNQWTLEGGQMSTGSMLRWFVNEFAIELKSQSNVYKLLDEQAEAIGPGSNGLVVLDYWCGNRTPYNDSKASGVIWGLTLNHSRTHVYRALLEGVAYGTAHTIKEFNKVGLYFDSITACGGGTNSDLWMQIYADVCDLPVQTLKFSGATALGAAIFSAVAAGQFETIIDAGNQMVGIKRIFEPQVENMSIYSDYLQQYIETYPALREKMHSVYRFADKE